MAGNIALQGDATVGSVIYAGPFIRIARDQRRRTAPNFPSFYLSDWVVFFVLKVIESSANLTLFIFFKESAK